MQRTSGPETTRSRQDGPVPRARHAAAAPVFVDASGRRQRRVRRLGLLLALPAVAYLALLVSAVLGGPGASSPYLPLPESAERHPGGPASGTPRLGEGDTRRPVPAPARAPEGRPDQASRTPGSAPGPTAPARTTTGPGPSASSAPGATRTTPAAAVVRGRSTASHPGPTHSTGRGRD